MINSLPNLLIVDDNDVNLTFLEIILGKLQVNLIKASSGFEALNKTNGQELALAILDIQMPEMNGFELAMKINEERGDNIIPIIFVTANHVNEIDVTQGYNSGAVDYIIKPINVNILLCKVHIFLDLFNHKQTIIREAELLERNAENLIWLNAALKTSEKRYRSYLNNAPDGVFITDRKGKFIEVNKAACKITGYTKDELSEMSVTDILKDEWPKVGLEQFKNLIRKGRSKADISFRHKDGRMHWLAFKAVKLSDSRFLVFSKDITKRKHAEDLLKESEANLATAQRIAHLGSWHWEKNKKEVRLSEEMFNIFNLSVETFDGEPESLIKMLHPDDVEPTLNKITTSIRNGDKSLAFEFRIIHKDYSIRYLFGEVRSEYDEVGTLQNIFGTIQDISERKQAEDLLKERESNLEEAQRIARVGSWHLNLITNTAKWSKEMFRIYDIDPDDFNGSQNTTINILHPDDKELFTAKMDNLMSGNSDSFEYRVIHKDGSVHNLYGQNRVETDKDGKPYKVFGTVQDITERKLAEQTLKISEEKYRTIINASPDGILLIDLKGIITEVSEIGLEIFGFHTKDDIVGKYFHQLVPAEEKDIIKDIFEKAMNEGLAQNIGIRLRKKNKSIFNAETSSTLIQGSDGAPLSFMIIIRDISQRKKIEAKQLHADRMANIGEMASGIAHEINQPLNIISMVMDKILFDAVKSETISFEFLKNKSDKIFDNITRIRNIIDHVRAFSRNDSKYVSTTFDINSSIKNAISMIQEQFNHLGIKLILRLDKNIPGIIGNTYKFEQVIVNLLANAKDALIEKKIKQPEFQEMIVGIETYSDSKFLVIELTDNGIGIDKEDLSNVMLPFYTTKDVGKGTGLGLSICYQIIKDINGTIDISSDKMNGTKIKLIIDIQKKGLV